MDPNIHYSAEVDIYLLVGGRRIPVAACLKESCRLFGPVEVPPGDAELVITIAGHERRHQIHLPNGISSDQFKFDAIALDWRIAEGWR